MNNYIHYIILLGLTEFAAMFTLKKFSISGSPLFLLFGMFCYFIIALFLSNAMSMAPIAVVNNFWNVVSTTTSLVLSLVVFGEKISSTSLIGIIVSSIGLMLIGLNGNLQN